jgi:hypothetical protein
MWGEHLTVNRATLDHVQASSLAAGLIVRGGELYSHLVNIPRAGCGQLLAVTHDDRALQDDPGAPAVAQ